MLCTAKTYTLCEITEMQTRAIIEAALACKARGIKVLPEIMVPLVGSLKELQNQADVINTTAAKVFEEKGDSVIYKVGTMIGWLPAPLLRGRWAHGRVSS